MSVTSSTPVKIWGFIKERKIPLIIVAVLVICALVGWRLLAPGKSSSSGYTTVVANYGDITEAISASGTVASVRKVSNTFKSTGYVNSCLVKVGDQVKKGQLLAEEQSNDLQASLDQATAGLEGAQANYNKLIDTKPAKVTQARAQLNQAQSALDLSGATLNRNQALYDAGALSKAELDSASNSYQSALAQHQIAQSNLTTTDNEGDIKSAAAQMKSAQAQVTQAQNNMNFTRMTAPFDGYISQLNGNIGQWTSGGTAGSSSTDSSQFSIVLSSTELQLTAEINEADISKVHTGQKVTFTVDTYSDRAFSGLLSSIAPEATTVSNVQMYEAVIAIDDYSLLKSGLPASITIITNTSKHIVVVPQTALEYANTFMAAAGSKTKSNSSTTAAKSFVVVLKNGRPVLQQVETGNSDDMNTEIKSGLTTGKIVVISGSSSSGSSSSSSKSNRSRGGIIGGNIGG